MRSLFAGFKNRKDSQDLSSTPDKIRKKQLILASVIGVMIAGGIIAILVVSQGSSKPKGFNTSTPEVKETKIESSGTRIPAEDLWRYKMEEDNKKLLQNISELREILKTEQEKSLNQGAQEEEFQGPSEQVQVLLARINELEDQLSQTQNAAQGVYPQDPYFGPGGKEAEKGIQRVVLKLAPKEDIRKVKKTVDNTIPAGAFVPAILLGGVDASTGLNSAADPRPVLLRLAGHGTLPRKFQSDLKDCHCIGSAYGDLSSERAYVRLEKLTCVERVTGEIIETQVAGYVAGEDGRAGLRGTVVARDSKLLQNSMIGGLLGGLSNSSSPLKRQGIVNPFSAGNQKIDAATFKEMMSSGVAEGAGTAMDRLSKYYIDRAEQIQPVIQIAAGRRVDIVFTEGTSIGDTVVRKILSETRDKVRVEAAEAYDIHQNLFVGVPHAQKQ